MIRVLQRKAVQPASSARESPAALLRDGPAAVAPAGLGYSRSPLRRAPATGDGQALPDGLRGGIESLSGLDMSAVRVHYNSRMPAKVNALAYAQGSQIHLGAGQERHLPHEAWHVVQQAQGRVKPTMQMKGADGLNEDAALEREADVMGARASQGAAAPSAGLLALPVQSAPTCIQRLPALPGILTLEAIIEFLQAAIAEGAVVSVADQNRISRYVAGMNRVANRALLPTYRALYPQAQYAVEGPIFKEIYENPSKPVKKKTRSKKRAAPEPIFNNEDSEESEGELDFEKLYNKRPRLYQQAIDHSDANHVEDAINPRNTNMLLFEGNTIIPASINGAPNRRAVRKSKAKLADKLEEPTDNLRGKQEQVFYASHLGRDRNGKLAESLERLKAKVRGDELSADAVKRLLVTSRSGFSIRETETHAEQTLLLSDTWDALKARLIKRIKGSAISAELTSVDSSGSAVLVTVILNRSSCRGCGVALSLALIEFWQELAVALGEKLDWQQMKDKYRDRLRFVVRFPTIYDYSAEKAIDFANLEEILTSLHSVGWEIAPIPPQILAGLESYKQLKASLEKIGALPSEKDMAFYKQGGKKGTGKADVSKDLGPARGALVQPPASASRVAQDSIRAYLTRVAPGWDRPFENVPGNGAQQGLNQGYFAHQVEARHQAVALPDALGGEAEQARLLPHGLTVRRNGGRGALCFVYAVLMGLTGQTEQEVADMANYVAVRAHAQGGWINADSQIAADVVAEIARIYGLALDVVVVQHGADETFISARAGQEGGHTVLIRQNPGHYDAYV